MSHARAIRRRTLDCARDLSASHHAPIVAAVTAGGDLVLASEGRTLGVVAAVHIDDFLERLGKLGARVTRPLSLGAQTMERSSSLDELRHVVAAQVGS